MRRSEQMKALGYGLFAKLRLLGKTPDEQAERDAKCKDRLASDVEEIRRVRQVGAQEWNALQDQRHQNDLNLIKRQEEYGLSERGLMSKYRRLYRSWVRRNG